MKKPRLVLVAAVAENGVIGLDGGMPWHLPGDLKHFKRTTLGKPVIMGRRTFEAHGALEGRSNIVLSRDPTFLAAGAKVAPNIEQALEIAIVDAHQLLADEIAVIGGNRPFADTLPLASRIYLTQVHASPVGDVYFPPVDLVRWGEIHRRGPLKTHEDQFSYSFVTLERIAAE